MVPVEQTCPKCHRRFIGSDAVGYPCPSCMDIDEFSLQKAIVALNKLEEILK